MRRFLRAFARALILTLRGQSPLPPRYRPLQAWIAAGMASVDAARSAAARDGVDLEALTLKLDGRPTSLLRALEMTRHNFVNEYPRLMRLDDPYSPIVIQSSNFNDHYRISQFLQSGLIASPALRAALADLEARLRELPAIAPEDG